jgi:hypothetical protein
MHGLQGGSANIETPALTGSLDGLKQELADALVSQGLYRKEADAMIETWRDSWFEEGMRVFYLVPRAWWIANCRSPFSPRRPRSRASSWAARKFCRPTCAIAS